MEDEVKYEYKSTPAKGEKNSQLTVGYNNDRSFVVRGNQIGVFKHNPDSLEFSTTIQDIKGMNGKSFSPSKVYHLIVSSSRAGVYYFCFPVPFSIPQDHAPQPRYLHGIDESK